MDFQVSLEAFWFVDFIIKILPLVVETYCKTNDYFYVVTMNAQKNYKIKIEIYREGYQGNKYKEHITVLKSDLNNICLPQYNYKFYLILSSLEPMIFTLMLTT